MLMREPRTCGRADWLSRCVVVLLLIAVAGGCVQQRVVSQTPNTPPQSFRLWDVESQPGYVPALDLDGPSGTALIPVSRGGSREGMRAVEAAGCELVADVHGPDGDPRVRIVVIPSVTLAPVDVARWSDENIAEVERVLDQAGDAKMLVIQPAELPVVLAFRTASDCVGIIQLADPEPITTRSGISGLIKILRPALRPGEQRD